jgi:hypothetical protein
MDAGAVAIPAKALGTFGGAGIDLAAIGRSLTFRTGIGKPAEDVLTATNVADALAADGVSHARMMIASAAGAVANEAAQLARGMLDTMFPPRQVFQIQQLGNPANLIGDALAAFADESVIATATRGTNDSRIVRAWTITGVVAAIDVAVLAAWARSKAKKRRVYAATLAAQDTA